MENKFGVIIQGPVFSYGSGGRNDNPEGFDSTDTIKKNIEIVSKYIPISNIVFSGWSSDSGINISNVNKIFSTDPFNFDYLNQKRQFYTIKKGFDYLSRNNEIQYFVKIRTDQFIPSIFWEWIILNFQKLDNQVLVSEFYNNSPFVFGDFILASSKKIFSDLINSQESKRLSINGSRNMVLKYLRSIHSDLGIQISRIYLFNDISLFLKFDQMYESWNSCINSSFFSIPIEIYKDIKWRGLSMDKRFENLEQIFTFKTSYSEKHTFKSFKTEYGRYVSFIKNYFRKKVKNYYLKYFKFNHKGSK